MSINNLVRTIAHGRESMMRVVTVMTMALIAHVALADSLFTQEVAEKGSLVTLKNKKFLPGDVITVQVKENIEASTDSNTNTKKESDVESEANSEDNPFLVTPKEEDGLGILSAAKLPNWKLGTKNEQRTTGKTQRKNSLVTTVTCTVQQVFPNNTIEIEGEKTVSVNREDSRIYVKGIARTRDVSPNNSIDSDQLANAVIELKGRGPLWNNQRRGLVTRLLDWVSPY